MVMKRASRAHILAFRRLGRISGFLIGVTERAQHETRSRYLELDDLATICPRRREFHMPQARMRDA